MRKILALVVLLLLSCSSGHSRPKGVWGPTVWITDNISLTFHQGVSEKDKALILEAATIHTQQFEMDWGSPVSPLQVFLLDVEVFDCDGNPAIGCHWAPNGPAQITVGSYLETPALYHEYVHHMIQGNDHKHTDPRWVSFWEPRRATINAGIISERNKWY